MAFLFGMGAFISSCQKSSDPISGEVSQTVANEAAQDSQQDEADDIATTQLNKVDVASRVNTGDDGRVACAKITVDSLSKEQGTVTIDFDNGNPAGAGCTDPRGNVRKGIITVQWAGGRWFKVGSVITITLTNYSINGVVISGTRVLTNITDNILKPTWTIVSNLTITWPDGKTATRQVHKTRQWDIAAGTVTVTQTVGADAAANGTTRRGIVYNVQISNPLVFKLTCISTSKVYIPVSGTKLISFGNKTAIVDYGSGDCDNTFTVTLNGKTDTMSADNGSDN